MVDAAVCSLTQPCDISTLPAAGSAEAVDWKREALQTIASIPQARRTERRNRNGLNVHEDF
jgi:hypothetical protein